MLFVAFNFAALLVFVCGASSLVASYILLFSKTFKTEFERQEKMQPHYKCILKRALIALVVLLFVRRLLHDHHFFSLKHP
jgi:hypothetical protein